MGPRIAYIAERLRRRREDDERGAELVEFALVVVLLIGLLYGIVSYGLILAAQSTITQAAADGARSGIVAGTATSSSCGSTVSAAGCAAVQQAASDLSWMSKGTCTEIVQTAATVTGSPLTTNTVQVGTGPITCTAVTGGCPSNTTNTCLLVSISYNYSRSPLFPLLPGLKEVTPSTLSTSNVLQISTPSGS